jgi:hypothetical protein
MYEKDTIIGGMNCQVLKKDIIGYSYEYKYYWYQVIGHEVTYTKYNSGVTYILNDNQFDTLYYFSGKINDHYKITDRLKGDPKASAYAVIKDTGSVIINSQKLKWQAVDYNFKVSDGHYTLRDTIIEKIGATKCYFLPWDIMNERLDFNQGGALRCYHDWMLGEYPGNQNCIFDLSLVTPNRFEPYINKVVLFPNPIVNTSVVRVQSNSHEPLKIEIYNYSGALIREDYFSGDYPIGSLQLTKGLYMYRIVCNTQVVKMDKIIVVN